MSDIILGIDLGTTNSCVAVYGEFPGHKAGDFTVICDEYKRKTTPSVVWQDPKMKLHVGHYAKQQAGDPLSPIMFAKRDMGSDKRFALREGTLSPIEVSARILEYLKALAEKQTGRKASRAVITVPAYFNTVQKEHTVKAGEAAGLVAEEPLIEPMAAALMYTRNDPRETLRILVYDLGGGTFDVTVLEKREGVFKLLAFDGDPFLGGYNFDKAIADWLLGGLIEQGYALKLDPNDPLDNARYAKLLKRAEGVKVDLSGRDVFETSLNEPDFFEDQKGTMVQIDMMVERKAFEGLIGEQIARSVTLTKQALAKAKVTADSLDEIIMVGGSSRIPLVREKMKEAFGREPKLVDPDLCVALGAAIKTLELGAKIHGRVLLDLDPLPPVTPMPEADVSGRIRPGDSGCALSEIRVRLARADGGYRRDAELNAEGFFLFEAVPLLTESANDFSLSVLGTDGSSLLDHSVQVQHRNDATLQTGTTSSFVAKPILILTKSGQDELIPEATPLPHEFTGQYKIADQSGILKVLFYEADHELGVVEQRIPKDLPIGSPVEVRVNIGKDYKLTGWVFLPSTGDRKDVNFQLKVVERHSVDELKKRFDRVRQRLEEPLEQIADKGLRMQYATRAHQLVEETRALLAAPMPDEAKIAHNLACLDMLVTELQTRDFSTLRPPFDEFESTVDRARTLVLQKQADHPEIRNQGYDRSLETLERTGRDAYSKQDQPTWASVNQRLSELVKDLDRLGRSQGGGASDIPPEILAPQIQMQLLQMVTGLSQQAQARGKAAEFAAPLRALQDKIRRVDVRGNPAAAVRELQGIYGGEFQPLEAQIGGPDAAPTGGEGLPDR